MTCSVYTSELFPQPPKSSPKELMNKVARVAGMEITYRLSNMDLPLTKAGFLQSLLGAQSLSSRDQHWVPEYGTIPGGDQPATWWQVDYTGQFVSWKKQCFVVLTGRDTYSGCSFVFPACNASVKTTICELRVCLILLSIWSNNSLPSISSSSCSSWLDRTVEWPFDDPLAAPAVWQYLSGLEQGSPEGCICFESATNIQCSFSHSQKSWVKQWKWEWHHTLTSW